MSVEGGGRFNSESERFYSPRREPERVDETLDSIEELTEYLRDPENRQEIVRFWECQRALNEFIRRHVPAGQRQQALRQLHQRITTSQATPIEGGAEATTPVVTPRSPIRTLAIGDHMDLTLGFTAAHQWPDKNEKVLTLGDSLLVTPSTPVGVIDYYRNIARLNTDSSLIGFSRALIASARQSLMLLAGEYGSTRGFQERGTEGRTIDVFSGMSHLARLAHRFGFTTFDIRDAGMRESATNTSFDIASGVAEANSEWQILRQNYKPAQVAMISSSDLTGRYGNKPSKV